MTEQTSEPEATEGQAPWDSEPEENWDGSPRTPADAGVTYPETPDNPHNHVYTWSPKLPDGSMLVIRAQSAHDLIQAVEAVAPLAGRLRAAWQAVTGGPQTAATPPPFGPNVSVPAAAGYQGPPVQQQPAPWGAQPVQQQQWPAQAQAAPQYGGAPAAQQGGQQRKEYPAPQGWYKLNVPYPGGTPQLHALATQLGVPKGAPAKGGMYQFYGLSPSGQAGKAWYCAPQVAQAFAQFTPVVA